MTTEQTNTGRGHFLVMRWLQLYQETKNPIYAWQTYQTARRLGNPIPDEVLQYLDGAAVGLVKTANKPPAAKERPIEISRALGLGKKGAGPGSPFADYTDRENKRKIAMAAFFDIEQHGKESAAFNDVGQKHGMAEATVRRYYQEYLNIWERMLKSLVAKGLIEFGHTDKNGKPQAKIEMQIVGNADDFREASIILTLAKRLLK